MRVASACGVVLALAVAGCSSSRGGSSGGSSNGKTTITELDYFTSSGGNAAMNWYNKQFEAKHPGVTVQRTAVSYANLITKVLQDASAGDMPNLVLLDNPNVPQVAATGQLRPLNDLPGFTTSGYYPGAIQECTFQGKQYCYPIGTNSVGLFYNKAMLKAAGLQPPTTWDELAADAKKLTKPPVYGMAFDATADEQSTWQLEPFFWSNGASLTKVDSTSVPVGPAALGRHGQGRFGLEVRAELGPGPRPHPAVHSGPRRDDGQRPARFSPSSTRRAGSTTTSSASCPSPPARPASTVVSPLGGETNYLGTGGSTEQQKLAWEWVQGMQQAPTMEHVTSLMYYLPTKPAVTEQVLKGGPEYTVFAKETQTARSRTTEYGANYPKVSQAIWTAIQASITGTSSVSWALQTAQGTISGVQQVTHG